MMQLSRYRLILGIMSVLGLSMAIMSCALLRLYEDEDGLLFALLMAIPYGLSITNSIVTEQPEDELPYALVMYAIFTMLLLACVLEYAFTREVSLPYGVIWMLFLVFCIPVLLLNTYLFWKNWVRQKV